MDILPSADTAGWLAGRSASLSLMAQSPDSIGAISAQASHPDFGHLIILVCEAVLEVVFISLPGFLIARKGMFDGTAQKTVATINITLFTPCLIFSKLAAQLTTEKLTELFIIPLILVLQTFIAFAGAQLLTRLFKIKKKPQRNFVTAMAVFGNSNSLPLSLVISLSQTISGLRWDKIPGDTRDEVGARGILYLLVFSQLGQALRWSWGMNSLLKPMSDYTPEERGEIPRDEELTVPYKDDPDDTSSESDDQSSLSPSVSTFARTLAEREPVTDEFASISGVDAIMRSGLPRQRTIDRFGDAVADDQPFFTRIFKGPEEEDERRSSINSFSRGFFNRVRGVWYSFTAKVGDCYRMLPKPLQKGINRVAFAIKVFVLRMWSCLNVPLSAIIASVIVATVPALQRLFFTRGTFVNNTVTAAINQSAGVAVPLILVVLGANLAQNTVPAEDLSNPVYKREKRNMLIAAILSRMVIPTAFMIPILGLTARYIPVSILGDPIFIIVCFLLTGAPSALQLAQMCQVNGVFVPVISKLLVYCYVVLIFPSTLLLVVIALKVLEFSKKSDASR